MSKKRTKLSTLIDDVNMKDEINYKKEYGLSDLNWRDDGGDPHDPSINEFNKGWQMDPYQLRQYAKNHKNILYKVQEGDSLGSISVFANKSLSSLYSLNGFSKEKIPSHKHLNPNSYVIVGVEKNSNEKTAADEVRDISYTPENLAKEIITLWKQVDGPLQNFFEAFTMNKTTNNVKKQIAEHLKSWGYDVKPVYTQDTPIYARFEKAVKKVVATRNPNKIIDAFIQIFPDSKPLMNLRDEVYNTGVERKSLLTLAEAGGMADYYKMIFPEDYAVSLVTQTFDTAKLNFEEFRDIQISDEALTQMEKMDSGNQTPIGNPNNGGIGGYDFTTQMRPDGPGGVAPTMYETRANNKVKNRINGIKKK